MVGIGKIRERGQSVILLVLALAAAGILIVGSAGSLTQNLLGSKHSYLVEEEQNQLSYLIGVVLSNPAICTTQLSITTGGAGFSMGTVLSTGNIVSNYLKVTSMTLTNQAVVNGNTQANFVVTAQDTRYPTRPVTTTVTGFYTLSGSSVTSCGLISSPQTACTKFGASWINSQNRCGICESLGGTWSNGQCTFG